MHKCKTIRVTRCETFVRKNWLSRRTFSTGALPPLSSQTVSNLLQLFVADETMGNFRFVLGRTGGELSGVFALYTTSACKQQECARDRLTFIVIIFLLDFETLHYCVRTTWRRLQAEASLLLYVHICLTVFNKQRSRGLDLLYYVLRWFRLDFVSSRHLKL